MKRSKEKTKKRLKAAGLGLGCLAIGIFLFYLRSVVLQRAETQSTTQPAVAATLPADMTPQNTTRPAGQDPNQPLDPNTPAEQHKAMAQGLSGLLLMFGLLAIAVTIICAGWIVWDIRQSRPAWKTQTKYPRRR